MGEIVLRALVAYDGTDFLGFQRQAEGRTVQGEIEAALAELYGRLVTVAGAGRTDAGVHARGQVIAFRADQRIPPERVAAAVNGLLPADLVLRESRQAADGFDPRRDAVARIYRYTLALDRVRQPLRDRFATRLAPGLDLAAMEAAAARLVGEHEFGSFCCEGGRSGSTRRTWRAVEWDRCEECLRLQVEADSFLYKQVRCTVGVLLAVGRGRFGPELVDRMLSGEPRPVQVAVAPPQGLVLEQVRYGEGVGAERDDEDL